MSFDALVVNPGRLRILTALATEERQEFVHLRRQTRLTDGNLAAHARRLQSAGLIDVDKRFRDGKPVTSYVLTPVGRAALEGHVRAVTDAVYRGGAVAQPAADPAPRDRLPTRVASLALPASPEIEDQAEEPWVD